MRRESANTCRVRPLREVQIAIGATGPDSRLLPSLGRLAAFRQDPTQPKNFKILTNLPVSSFPPIFKPIHPTPIIQLTILLEDIVSSPSPSPLTHSLAVHL
ncbi:hypothetical protein VTL71DRAFT_324 [Oculimacula yallundae]|uniref:Uncharacterized protein n=1 Tax=Oculimacula yallundae TaxID=86028 RepID=A0ABR4D0T1_9HELO